MVHVSIPSTLFFILSTMETLAISLGPTVHVFKDILQLQTIKESLLYTGVAIEHLVDVAKLTWIIFTAVVIIEWSKRF